MALSVIGVLTSSDPFQFYGRYVLESGQELTDTLLSEYKKRFNDPEKFATWLLKYHWLKLSNTPFGAYMVSSDLALSRKLKRSVAIFIGEKVNFMSEEVEWVEPSLLGAYIDTLYLISVGGSELSIFRINEDQDKWTKQEVFDLKALSEAAQLESNLNKTILL